MMDTIKNYLKKKVIHLFENKVGTYFFKHKGYCPCCDAKVSFVAKNPWLRDHFLCNGCKSIPRERALMHIIETQYPNWQELAIHESSPGERGHSLKLKREGKNYLESQYFPGHKKGDVVNGIPHIDLEDQSFDDASFDLVITSDVMEHIYEPDKAFKEIYRTLKPGGAHIFSVPIINKHKPTQRWANKGPDGAPEFLFDPEWHGNPVDAQGSPVTMHWGFDIIDFISEQTGAQCSIEYLNDLSLGIQAEYIEIVVQRKPKHEES